MLTHYELFIKIINDLYRGLDFIYESRKIHLTPSIISPYDLIATIKEPKNDIEKYLNSVNPTFKKDAKSALYRTKNSWIKRGVLEQRIVTFKENGTPKIVPIFDSQKVTGIDSSSHIIAICCFDNYASAYFYVENILCLPKSTFNYEYKWNKLNKNYRKNLNDNLETLLNIACKKMFLIDTNLINSSNHLTINQLIGMIDGCFTGYEKDPEQNSIFRTNLRKSFFELIDNVQCHCDPDFHTLKPPEIVRILVRTLSKHDGKPQVCTPVYANLRSHESQPLQLTDLIAGCMNTNLKSDKLPFSIFRLKFDERYLSVGDRKKGVNVKAYYWERKLD
jgi:hypothetical protein